MKRQIKDAVKKQMKNIQFYNLRKELVNRDFTIISNNCWGGIVYQDFKLPYNSPFIGMFIHTPDYFKLLNNLEYYMNVDLKFTTKSKYDSVNKDRETGLHSPTFPIGLLDDVELDMLHYASEHEAYEKWNRRKERMNWDNLYIKACEKLLFTHDNLADFASLPFKNKVIFTREDYRDLENSVHFKDLSVRSELNFYTKYFEVARWLNTGEVVKK